jgi:uncharacterized protein YbaR (Trm112 family)
MDETTAAPETAATASPERANRKLLEVLVCPLTKMPLEYDEARQELISRAARLAYPIRSGIPHMLPSEARDLDADTQRGGVKPPSP